MGVGRGALIVVVACVAATDARAEAKVDWATGFVTATGVGVADRHAPSPAVARSTARRGADDAAKLAIGAAVGAIAVAGGGTLGDRMKDAKVAKAVKEAVAHAIALAADPETDGAWTVTLGVPLEALRQAIDGPRALAGNDVGAPVVVVHGAIAPALGYRIGAAGAAIVWRPTAEPGAPATTATATGNKLVLAQPLGSPAALFVVVP